MLHRTTSPPVTVGDLVDRLRASDPQHRLMILGSYLNEHVSRVLGIRDGRLEPDRPLDQLGLDSLMAVELKHRLKRDVGVDVPLGRLLDDLTVEDLARVLHEAIPEASAGVPVPAEPTGKWTELQI